MKFSSAHKSDAVSRDHRVLRLPKNEEVHSTPTPLIHEGESFVPGWWVSFRALDWPYQTRQWNGFHDSV